MLNNQYFIIYNNSFDLIYKNLKFYINEELETFKKNYILKNSKKITGYMLYVRDYYKDNNKKKEITENWKQISETEKKKYNERANKLLKIYNKMINKKEKKKEIEIKKEIILKTEKKQNLNKKIEKNYIIKSKIIENKNYYIDCYNNIIDIEKEKYIGYLNDNKIYLY